MTTVLYWSLMRRKRKLNPNRFLQAYIIGVALGDGNLSNPNGRAVRLRVTCDKKYPKLMAHIKNLIEVLLPENKVTLVNKVGCMDISVYSNQLPELIGYPWDKGSKIIQNVGVHAWIKNDLRYSKECLRGLFQTDGCIYKDRGYLMANFTSAGERLASDTLYMMRKLGYHPRLQKIIQTSYRLRYTIRLAKNAEKFIQDVNLWKE